MQFPLVASTRRQWQLVGLLAALTSMLSLPTLRAEGSPTIEEIKSPAEGCYRDRTTLRPLRSRSKS